MGKSSNFGGILVLIGFLLMTTVGPGETLGPYIAVMTAALAAVIVGARIGGYWQKKVPPGMAVPKRHRSKYTIV